MRSSPNEKRLAESLRTHGYKITRPRRAVIHALAEAAEPLSINDLHERAQDIAEDVGLVTVYRTLELLQELDLARPVHLGHNCHGYILATPGHTHHLVCRRCNTAIEFEGCDLEAFFTEIEAKTGFRVTGHWLELEGLCMACQQASE